MFTVDTFEDSILPTPVSVNFPHQRSTWKLASQQRRYVRYNEVYQYMAHLVCFWHHSVTIAYLGIIFWFARTVLHRANDIPLNAILQAGDRVYRGSVKSSSTCTNKLDRATVMTIDCVASKGQMHTHTQWVLLEHWRIRHPHLVRFMHRSWYIILCALATLRVWYEVFVL